MNSQSSAVCCHQALCSHRSLEVPSFSYRWKNKFILQTQWTHTCPHMPHLNEVKCLHFLRCVCVCLMWHIHKIIRWEINTQIRKSGTKGHSILAMKYRVFTVAVYLLLTGGGGNTEAKVIRPKGSSCSEGASQQQCVLHPPTTSTPN